MPAASTGPKAIQSIPSSRPNAAQAKPTASDTSHHGWRGVPAARAASASAVAAGVRPPPCTRAHSCRTAWLRRRFTPCAPTPIIRVMVLAPVPTVRASEAKPART